MEYQVESGQHEEILERAEALLEDDEAEEALSTIRLLYGAPLPSSVRGRALAVEVVSLELLDQFETAEGLIAETMKQEGDDFHFVLAAGTEFTDLEAFDHAEVFLGNLCGIDPDNPLPWYNLAIMYGRDERYHEAVQAYNHTLERNPDYAPAYLQKGYCMRLLGQPDEAMRLYLRYLEMEPDDGDAWCSLAVMESELGQYEAAYGHYKKALTTRADAEEVYFNWALTAAQKNDSQQLEGCLAHLEEVAPDSWRTLLTRADLREAAGEVWDAWEDVTEAFETVVDDGDVDEAEYVAACMLRFAFRNDMDDHLGEFMETIYRYELFSDEVLEILRLREGRSSHAVASYQVVIRSENGESPDELDYYVYGVFAENESDAVDEALRFQGRCGGADWEVDSVQRISEFDEGVTGVYWRSDCSDRPPDAPGALES